MKPTPIGDPARVWRCWIRPSQDAVELPPIHEWSSQIASNPIAAAIAAIKELVPPEKLVGIHFVAVIPPGFSELPCPTFMLTALIPAHVVDDMDLPYKPQDLN